MERKNPSASPAADAGDHPHVACLQALIASPERVAELSPEQVPPLIAHLNAILSALWSALFARFTSGTSVEKSADALQGRLLTAQEVAARFSLPEGKVYKMARKGEIPATKLGKYTRFPEKALERWLSLQVPNQDEPAARARVSKLYKGR